MNKKTFTTYFSICLFILVLLPSISSSGELIIHDGSTLTVGENASLIMDCAPVTIESGGAFLVDGGMVTKRGELIKYVGATYTILSGSVDTCFIPALSPIFLLLLQ